MYALPRILLVVAALLLAGCGGGGDGGEAVTGGADAGTFPLEPSTDPTSVSGEPTDFESTEFQPPISFRAPAGWRVEESFGLVQAFRGTTDTYVLTFESGGKGDAAADAAKLQKTPTIDAQPPKPVTVAAHKAQRFEATVNENGPLEGSEYFAIQWSLLRVWVIDVEGTLVRAFGEAGSLRMDARDETTDVAFFEEVDEILKSLEFGAAGG